MRKGIALLSVLLVLTAFKCMATCIVSDAGLSGHTRSSTTVPPCHKHHQPAQQNSVPCQNHPGLLAYSLEQPFAYVDVPVNLVATVYEPMLSLRAACELRVRIFAHTPPLPRPEALSSIVLRI